MLTGLILLGTFVFGCFWLNYRSALDELAEVQNERAELEKAKLEISKMIDEGLIAQVKLEKLRELLAEAGKKRKEALLIVNSLCKTRGSIRSQDLRSLQDLLES